MKFALYMLALVVLFLLTVSVLDRAPANPLLIQTQAQNPPRLLNAPCLTPPVPIPLPPERNA